MPVNRIELSAHVKQMARDLGFSPVGITTADPPGRWAFFQDWLSDGHAGEMSYLARNGDKRSDPRVLVPGARSIVCVGLNYLPPVQDGERDGPHGEISSYARGDDYHEVMKHRLRTLLDRIAGLDPKVEGRYYVDTGPVFEREYAARAGLGWFGKHTNLIEKRTGSYFFLGELILTTDLEPDAPAMDHCGTCTRCMDACPTDAIPEPYVLDSNRCISYLTIELKGPIPKDLRRGMGSWVYGCDVCQDVCPWNVKYASPTGESAFQARPGSERPDLHQLLGLSQDAFSKRFRKSPIKRTKRRGLLRNAAIALGNVGAESDVPVLARALEDDEPLVRGHAAWALGRIGGDAGRKVLASHLQSELDPDVREEIESALGDQISE